jgi:hypothetical protein
MKTTEEILAHLLELELEAFENLQSETNPNGNHLAIAYAAEWDLLHNLIDWVEDEESEKL